MGLWQWVLIVIRLALYVDFRLKVKFIFSKFKVFPIHFAFYISYVHSKLTYKIFPIEPKKKWETQFSSFFPGISMWYWKVKRCNGETFMHLTFLLPNILRLQLFNNHLQFCKVLVFLFFFFFWVCVWVFILQLGAVGEYLFISSSKFKDINKQEI